MGVARLNCPLPISIAFCILWMGVAVVAPVVWMALEPRSLGIALVAPVVRVGLQLAVMPIAFPGALAFWQ
jgi:hypothetical protein